MRNIKLILSYDGRAYLGWQKTRTGQSIEQTLQNVIEKIVQHPVHLQAASRTDAGVHANGQVVNFTTSKTHLDLERFCVSLNSLLPKDIVALRADWMPASFHPTLDSICKEYRYFICFGSKQLPHHRFYSWHVSHLLDLVAIREAIPLLIGRHNFAVFCNVKKNEHYKDYIREVQLLELIEIEEMRVYFRIRGNHFLYKMVRNIIGTLIDIGRGKIALQTLSSILESQSRPQAGVTAPAHGLFLYEVCY
jgi:tRNA pseudouridine38-40 synthase